VPAAIVRYRSVRRDGYEPLIEAPGRTSTLLSFLNLTELHVLTAIRREHKVKMPSIRSEIEINCLAGHAETDVEKRHPLIGRALETDGLDLFSQEYANTSPPFVAGITKSGIVTAYRSL